MAKLGSFRRIYSDDYDPEYKGLIDSFGITYNASIEALYDALNKRLTFSENFASTLATVNITVNSNGVPIRQTTLKLDDSQINASINGVVVLSAIGSRDQSLLPTGGVYVSATKSEGTLIIQNVKGLQADKAYNLTLLII